MAADGFNGAGVETVSAGAGDEGAASTPRPFLAMLIQNVLAALGIGSATLPIAKLFDLLDIQTNVVSSEELEGESFWIDVDGDGVVLHLAESTGQRTSSTLQLAPDTDPCVVNEFAWHGVAEAIGYAVLIKLGLHTKLLDRAACERSHSFAGVAELRKLATTIGEEVLVPDWMIAEKLGTPRKLVYCANTKVMSDDDRWFDARCDAMIAALGYSVLKDIVYDRACTWLRRELGGENPWLSDGVEPAEELDDREPATWA